MHIEISISYIVKYLINLYLLLDITLLKQIQIVKIDTGHGNFSGLLLQIIKSFRIASRV